MREQYKRDAELAVKAVSEGAEIIQRYHKGYNALKSKESYRDIVTDIDILVEKKIKSVLDVTGYHILGEESANHSDADTTFDSPTWVIDPIDGTANYVASLPFYSVSIGLIGKKDFIHGAVIVPESKEIFFSMENHRAYANGRRLVSEPAEMKNSLIVAAFSGKATVSEKREKEYELFGAINDHSRGCLRLGSAAVNICLVAAGKLQAAYGIANKIWDVAGAIAVALSAGCDVRTEFVKDTYMISYVVGCQGVADEISKMIRERELANLQPICRT